MFSRRTLTFLLAGLAAAFGALFFAVEIGAAQDLGPRVSFQILTGSSGGTYFPVGQLIAGLISHPPGVGRCESAPVCGPPGLVISARTSDGSVANVRAVNDGFAESGFAQGDVVSQAVAGKGAFRRTGRLSNLRVIAGLFPEEVHLIVARNARIARVEDLAGKRVSLGAESSGTVVTARAILNAYGIGERQMKVQHNSSEIDAQLLEQGRLDAFFFVGGTPVALIDDLIAHGVARLVPIDGKTRAHLIRTNPALTAGVIPAGTYRGAPAVQTVGVRAFWIVNNRVPDNVVYGIVRALFDPGNRAALDQAMPPARQIRLTKATSSLPAPLHPGAARYYREAGRLTRQAGELKI